MSRKSDGELQIKFNTNAFWRALRGYVAIGAFPISNIARKDEFSPIDAVAEAILKLSSTAKEFTVFHASNSHNVQMGDILVALQKYGFKIDVLSDHSFGLRLKEYAMQHSGDDTVAGIIAYNARDEEVIYQLEYTNDFTVNVLYQSGFTWPITDEEYLNKAIKALDTLGFFG